MDDSLSRRPTELVSPWPTGDFEQILQACDPGEALLPGDSRYLDLSSLRSGVGVRRLQNTLRQRTADGKYHHCLLCGHRGSGKSTELLNLRAWANENGYLALWEQVDVRFGLIDLDYADLFLLAATMVDETIQAHNHILLAPKLRALLQWFHEITKEDEDVRLSEIGTEVGGQLGGSLPLGLGSLFAKVTASFKGSTKHTQKVRETIRRFPNDLINLTRDFLAAAHQIVVEQVGFLGSGGICCGNDGIPYFIQKGNILRRKINSGSTDFFVSICTTRQEKFRTDYRSTQQQRYG